MPESVTGCESERERNYHNKSVSQSERRRLKFENDIESVERVDSVKEKWSELER